MEEVCTDCPNIEAKCARERCNALNTLIRVNEMLNECKKRATTYPPGWVGGIPPPPPLIPIDLPPPHDRGILEDYNKLWKRFEHCGYDLEFNAMIPPPKAEKVFDPMPIYEEFIGLRERFKKQGFTLPEPLCDMPPPL